jgi:hypothetical protein
MAEEVRRLTAFPRNELLDEPVLAGKVSELELFERLGPPTAERESAAFEDPRQFWDLEWSCGLVMAIEYHQLTEQFLLYLDSIDVDHALRHLEIEVRALEDETRDRFDRVESTVRTGTWAVVVVVDGERRVLARNLTERDAACRARELAERFPQHSYSIELTA